MEETSARTTLWTRQQTVLTISFLAHLEILTNIHLQISHSRYRRQVSEIAETDCIHNTYIDYRWRKHRGSSCYDTNHLNRQFHGIQSSTIIIETNVVKSTTSTTFLYLTLIELAVNSSLAILATQLPTRSKTKLWATRHLNASRSFVFQLCYCDKVPVVLVSGPACVCHYPQRSVELDLILLGFNKHDCTTILCLLLGAISKVFGMQMSDFTAHNNHVTAKPSNSSFF